MATDSSSAKGLVVITGASAGIGAACAQAFSAAGHPLLLLARRVEPMEALALPNSLCEPVDVADLDAVNAAVAKAVERFGPVDCIVNNAGCMLLSAFVDQDPKEIERMISVNVFGVINGCKAVMSDMIERKAGTIINISSIAGRKLFPSHSVYCATKFAVHAFTEAIREEASEHGVRCCVIAPGVVETELLSHTSSEAIKDGYKSWKTGELKGKPLLPEDIAQTTLFAYQMPAHATVREIVIGPTFQKA